MSCNANIFTITKTSYHTHVDLRRFVRDMEFSVVGGILASELTVIPIQSQTYMVVPVF
jgi:hypothetical protein